MALAPILPLLFEGLDALGGLPGRTRDLLVRAGLQRDSRILDVACGKGGTSVELAATLGCRVVGIDAYQPFLDRAKDLARECRVSHLCRWQRRDVLSLTNARFDAAIMIGLSGFETAAPIVRKLTRRGGIYAMDDAVHLMPSPYPPALPTIADARALFASFGDELLVEDVPSSKAIERLSTKMHRQLERNVTRAARDHPRLARSLHFFLERHAAAGRALRDELRPVLWVVRKG